MHRFANRLVLSSLLVIGLAIAHPAANVLAAPPAPRQLAPGVLTTIAPSLEPTDTVSTHDVMELRKNPVVHWTPEFLATTETLSGMSDKVKFRREIYCLEFSFKPLRIVEVDVPIATGSVERKQVWYLLYKVSNTGKTLKPVAGPDGVYTVEAGKGGPLRFNPQFVLESEDRQADGKRVTKSYLDRVIPAAVALISKREMAGGALLNSVEMAEQTIPVNDGRIDRGLWGVATWVDVDPRIDFFSVFVGGLTNAYRWTDDPDAYQHGDTPGRGRRITRKMLQLNFWRPGDELQLDEREFRFGPPLGKSALYGVGDGVAYRWVYR